VASGEMTKDVLPKSNIYHIGKYLLSKSMKNLAIQLSPIFVGVTFCNSGFLLCLFTAL